MPTWKQERPTWCPHTDCGFCMRVHDSLCGGHLPKPEPHDGDFNDHRLCLRFRDDGEVVDFQCNDTDLWHLTRVIEKVKSPPKSGEVAIEHDDKTTAEHVFESLEVPDITEPDAEEGEGGDVDVVCSKCGSNDICPSDIEGMFICRSCGADLYSSGVSTDDMLESIAAATAIYPRSELEFEVALTTALRKANNVSAANNALRIRVKDLEAELELERGHLKTVDRLDEVTTDELNRLKRQVDDAHEKLDSTVKRADEAQAEVKRVRKLIERDGTGLAVALDAVRRIVGGYSWIPDGAWGSYPYEEQTEETLRREIGDMYGRVVAVIKTATNESGDRVSSAYDARRVLATNNLDDIREQLGADVEAVRLTVRGFGDRKSLEQPGADEAIGSLSYFGHPRIDDGDELLLVKTRKESDEGQEERHGGDDSGSRTEGNDRGAGGDDTG